MKFKFVLEETGHCVREDLSTTIFNIYVKDPKDENLDFLIIPGFFEQDYSDGYSDYEIEEILSGDTFDAKDLDDYEYDEFIEKAEILAEKYFNGTEKDNSKEFEINFNEKNSSQGV